MAYTRGVYTGALSKQDELFDRGIVGSFDRWAVLSLNRRTVGLLHRVTVVEVT